MMDEGIAGALRARDAIEDKIRSQDYISARTLLLEALQVYPRLNQFSEMLTVCEILCAAEMELPGSGIDWYWVLQLFPTADPTIIEAQYQKLVSQLETIKNDFPGTELALKFAGDAFAVLSNPAKRAAFDAKRDAFREICEDSNSGSSSRPKRAADEDCSGNGDADKKQKKKICALEENWGMDQINCEENGDIQIYLTDLGDQVNCEENGDIQMPLIDLGENSLCSPPVVAYKKLGKDYYDFESNKTEAIFSVGQVWAAYDQEHMPRCYGRINKITNHKHVLYVTWFKSCSQSSHEKQWLNAGFMVTCGTFVLEVNKTALREFSMLSHMISDDVMNQIEIYPKKGEIWAIYEDWAIEWCSNPGMRMGCTFAIVEILTDFMKDSGVKVVYLVKVDGFKNVFQRYLKRGNELSFLIPADKLLMFSHKIPAFRCMGGEMTGMLNGMLDLDPSAVPDNLTKDFSCAIAAVSDSSPQSNEEVNCSDEVSVTHLCNPSTSLMDAGASSSVTKSQKPKLTPKDFEPDQVWAVYDSQDAMPRSYVQVNNVVSLTKVCVTVLEPHPMLDGEIQWLEESLPIVCGIFRASRDMTELEISKFSHLVHCDTSSKKSFFRIFPRKGEIWAMYKNWNCRWKSSDLNGYQCKVVEILSDFSEESGVRICALTEVKGCLTFFQRQMYEGFQLTRQLSRLELLSFSHRIPAFIITGIKNHDIPKGSWHLEPDALPIKSIK